MLLSLQQQLGPLAYPLLLCALVASIILIERLGLLLWLSINRQLDKDASQLLQQQQHQAKVLREEMLAVWLQGQQKRLTSGLRLLQIIAMIAPLLGLLGTVLGLIEVFERLSTHHGPIDPALLAEGLGIAMKTTAAGLLIAIPALFGAHGLQLWCDQLINSVQNQSNIQILRTAGVQSELLL